MLHFIQKKYSPRFLLSMTLVLTLIVHCLLNGSVVFAAQAVPTANTSQQVKVVDDTGYELTLQKPAKRVLALYGAFNELMLALGLKDLLVGRTAQDIAINELKHLPAVGTHLRPNIEFILSLKPDVIIQFMGREDAQSLALGLRGHNLPVLMFHMDGFDDMFNVIQKLGQVTGHEKEAETLVKRYQNRLGDLRRILQDEKRVRVFYEIRYPNLLAAGTDNITTDIIQIAGGRNVISLSGQELRINEEEVIDKNPDAYIIQVGPLNPEPRPLDMRPKLAALSAVKNGRVLMVDHLAFTRPGPRAIDAAENLAKWLHPKVNFDLELN